MEPSADKAMHPIHLWGVFNADDLHAPIAANRRIADLVHTAAANTAQLARPRKLSAARQEPLAPASDTTLREDRRTVTDPCSVHSRRHQSCLIGSRPQTLPSVP